MSDPAILPEVRSLIEQEIRRQRLPENFSTAVAEYYRPLAHQLVKSVRSLSTSPCFVGIQGSQGSGKSTCADFIKLLLEAEFDIRVVVMSLDDFYLTKAERLELAEKVDPLFVTRGVPGTHDTGLLNQVFDDATAGSLTTVPTFNKAIDDRHAEENWQRVDGAIDIVVLEGWCVGIPAQADGDLAEPVNQLEATEDKKGQWRRYVNQQLYDQYAALFARLDFQIALQAPSFECVFDWRLKQEQKMIAKLEAKGADVSKAQTPEQIERFISHYQRLTEHALTEMPGRADWLLRLNKDHSFAELCKRSLANDCTEVNA